MRGPDPDRSAGRRSASFIRSDLAFGRDRFGDVIARRILGAKDAATAFDDLAFTMRFFHWGRPWFMPLVMRYCP